MDRADLAELHFITSIENLPSILRHGIVSNRRSNSLHAVSIALEEIQARRANKRVPGGRMVHEYANLYINGRNPMLYRRLDLHTTISVLSVDPAVLDIPGVVITDRNASSDWVRFAGAPGGLGIVDANLTMAEYWTHADVMEQWRHKSAMCAEVLVPDAVQPRYIRAAYVSGDQTAERIEALGLGLRVVVNRRLFFR